LASYNNNLRIISAIMKIERTYNYLSSIVKVTDGFKYDFFLSINLSIKDRPLHIINRSIHI